MNERFGTQIEALRKQGDMLGRDVRQRTIGYITAAFGLVAGLAWNDAIGAMIAALFPLQKNTVLAKFTYAVVITVVLVVVTVYLLRRFEKKEKENAA